MGSADLRKDRNDHTTPLERLQFDMRENGYFARGVLAGKKAHTNEHIQADAILAILELVVKNREQNERIGNLEKRLKSAEGRIATLMAAIA